MKPVRAISWPLVERWSPVLPLLLSLALAPLVWRLVCNDEARDFLQEWTSACNHFAGLGAYANQKDTLPRHIAIFRGDLLDCNAHPPASVLLTLPFGLLDYLTAYKAVFNLLSLLALLAVLVLIAREMGFTWSWRSACWAVAGVLAAALATPLREQVLQGQWNLVLLLLLTGTWALDRRGRDVFAGTLLGLAAAIKLFPAFLLLFYLLQRRWTVLVAAAGTVLAVGLFTGLVLGFDVYPRYAFEVLPALAVYRSSWPGVSLANFWAKLFDPAPKFGLVVPLLESPRLVWWLTALSRLAVVGGLSRFILRSHGETERNRAFALTVLGMLLVSPIAWDSYLVLLLLPGVLIWTTLPAAARPWFLVLAAPLVLHRYFFWALLVCDPRADWIYLTAQPWQVLTGLSIQFYALLACFLFGLTARMETNPQRQRGDNPGTGAAGLTLRASPLNSAAASR